ncbi:carboxypeptidase-like regulatory domain-containing protein [Thermoplasma sp.]|uniref:carboxypeptidase-like regulatory domain-containing protein n=1 Tax=Thermoplasma sp. TaxID=1973142 RepID=UPI00126FE006|nr:carboxypeptidase-like regulatory domain-containing protein [Thermoplasma sp.]KAA8923162.1 MAG: carboxypeptidase regulatory-like domain-containing protein [Thermoplasma sp.]
MPKEQVVFVNQTLNRYAVGLNSSYFIPSGNATIWVQGYLYNRSSSARISDTELTVAAGPYSTYYNVSASGYYRIGILKTGKANIAFYVYGYNTVYHYFDFITSGTVWLNLSFSPSAKYIVHGFTLYNSSAVPNVEITFVHGASVVVESGIDGSYNASLYNGTYVIGVYKPGFGDNASPNMINIDGHSLMQNITLISSGARSIVISGYVKNEVGKTVSNATVMYDGYVATSNRSGFYTINVSAGPVILIAIAEGYGYGNVSLLAVSNQSDVNITLPVADPMLGGNRATSRLPENQTYINGSSPGTYLLVGQAYYNSSGHRIPLTSAYIKFLISIQGTGFYVMTRTNDQGYYNITLLYAGYYNFSADAVGFYPYNFSVQVRSETTHHDLHFVPRPGSSYTVTLKISNSTGLIPYNVSVYSAGIPVGNFSFNGSGSLSLIGGNYTFSVNDPGYKQLNLSEDITSSADITGMLEPVSSIGPGLSQNTEFSVPIAYYPSSNGSSIYANKVIHLDLKFLYGDSSVNSSEFEMFMVFDSAEYRYLGNTSSNGTDIITLNYTGHYYMRFYFLKYRGNLTVNATGNTSATVQLEARTLYTLSFDLYNYSRIFNLTDQRIPESTISLNGNAFGISPKMADNGSRLFVNYTLPRSNYTFKYSNSSFMPYSFSLKLSSNTSVPDDLIPYIIAVENESVTPWYFSLSSDPGSSINISYSNITVTSEKAYLLAPGTYSFRAYLTGADLNPANSTSVVLNAAHTMRVIVFNVTNFFKNFTSERVYPLSLPGGEFWEEFNISYNSNGFVPGYIHNITFIGLNISTNNTTMLINTSQIPIQVIPVSSDYMTLNDTYINSTSEIQVQLKFPFSLESEYLRYQISGSIQEYRTNLEVM